MGEIIDRDPQNLDEQLREYKALLQISQMLAQSLDLPTILRQIVDASVSLIPKTEQAVIHLIDESNELLKPAAVARPDLAPFTTPIFFKPGEGIAGLVIASAQTINVADTFLDERFLHQESNQIKYRSLLVAPIKLHDDIIGTLSVESQIPNAYNEYHERLLTNLGEQAALAIERAQVLKEEQEQRQLAETLREISNIQGSNANLQHVLNHVLVLVNRVLAYDTALIMLIENNRVKIAQHIGEIKNSPGISLGIDTIPHLKQMHETGQPVIIRDARSSAEWVFQLLGARSWLAAPLHAKGEVVGYLSVGKKEAGFYEPKHADRIMAFASQASLTIENAQLFETIQRRLREVNLLNAVSQKLAEFLDTELILQQVVQLLKEQFGFYFVQVLLIDTISPNLKFRQVIYPEEFNFNNEDYFLNVQGIPAHVAISGQPFLTNDVRSVPFFDANEQLPKTYAELAVPLRTGDKLLGVLDIHHQFPHEFEEHDLQLILTISEQITLAIEKTLIYNDLQKTLAKEQAARAQLVQSEKLAALGRIVASVAHELNNPLQAIQNALYLINLEESLNEQSRKDLQVAINEADRMAGLIARLRDIYRPTTSEEFQRCSINDLVVEVEKLINVHLRRNNVTFTFLPDPHLPECFVIQDQIKQVVLNISLNAVESMTKGGTLTIKSFYEADQNRVRLDFSDTGSGIHPEVLPYIFDPFVTTKDRGTGLGLAITYDIIRRHGGHIEPESILNKGTTFHVWLPVQPPKEIPPAP